MYVKELLKLIMPAAAVFQRRLGKQAPNSQRTQFYEKKVKTFLRLILPQSLYILQRHGYYAVYCKMPFQAAK